MRESENTKGRTAMKKRTNDNPPWMHYHRSALYAAIETTQSTLKLE
jgi:hypothetical protein